MKLMLYCWGWILTSSILCGADLTITSFDAQGRMTVSNALPAGVVTAERSFHVNGFYFPTKSVFSTQSVVNLQVDRGDSQRFFHAVAVDLTPGTPNGRPGFTNLVYSYDTLYTIAGAGGDPSASSKWQPQFEGGAATQALLSRPHIALADHAGNVYIADKEAHAIRKVRPDGIIVTAAGNNIPGDALDVPSIATNVSLNQPNGMWISNHDIIYILDLENSKIRRLTTNGMMSTLFRDFSGIWAGRGLWVSEDESLAYFSSGTQLKKWTPNEGVTVLANGFVELGNIAMSPSGELHATDRSDSNVPNGHYVWKIHPDGTKEVVAGNGLTFGGGDGFRATETGLNEVRGIWFLPTGAYFVCTHRGSQIWYVDTDGYIHLFLNGDRSDTHSGDGRWFYNPFEFKVSEVRAITADREGNLLITEHDSGYIRKVDFRRHVFAD